MSAPSPDLERQVNRMDSGTTQVGEDYTPGDWNPVEKVPLRFSFDQASPADNPYDYVGL